jgi:hypothetical protein
MFLTADLLAAASLAQTVDLPKLAPIPKLQTPDRQPATAAPNLHLPVAQSHPGRSESGTEPEDLPQAAPLPTKRPRSARDAGAPTTSLPVHPNTPGADSKEAPDIPKPDVVPPDPRSSEIPSVTMPAAELACRERLQKLGVRFENRSAEHDEKGCAMPYPLAVQSLGPDVKLEPEAVMNCAMAETMAHFASGVIDPAAQRELGAKLASISHASAYVCRPRNGSAKLSEHAFGNALDIARFNLSNGTSVDVTPTPGEREARFLGSVRKGACGPFKTVLGPGSDADHGTHFHFDLAPRKNGGTFCE